MLRYIAHRLLVMIPTLVAISFVIFVVIKLPPGDFLSTRIEELRAAGEPADIQEVDRLRKEFRLDLPFHEQYAYFLWDLVRNEIRSMEYDRPVSEIIGDRLWLSIIVAFATVIFTYIVAFPIGVYSATHQYSWGDHGLTFLGFLGLATPNFLLALVLVYFANVWFGIEIGGLMDEQYIGQGWSWGKFTSILEHLWIPVVVIGTAGTAGMIRRLRANLLDELQKQYVVTGRAKGLPPFRLLMKYPLRMSLNPFIADIGELLPHIVSGAVIVSVVLNLPTTGKMLYEALLSLDMNLAGSFLMGLSLLTVIGMLISDLALAWLDPRIRLEGKAAK
ncbi:MAG: ABC transporter permease [Rhodospirillaceae bacterium]|nr:ABC transporter permease [Rhodospirillaceae bacterium]